MLPTSLCKTVVVFLASWKRTTKVSLSGTQKVKLAKKEAQKYDEHRGFSGCRSYADAAVL